MNAITRTLLGSIVIGAALHAAAAPEVTGTVNIVGNKASNITTGGGSGKVDINPLGLKGGSGQIDLTGVANVNSVVLNDPNAKITGTVNVVGNSADNVKAIGGTANVNSLVLGK